MCMRFAAVLVGCRKYVVRWGDGIAGCGAKEERLGKRNWQKCLADRNRTSDRWMSAYYSTVHRSTNWATTSSRIPSVGIEPTTLGLLDPRSNQLSYEGLLTIAVLVDNPVLCAMYIPLPQNHFHALFLYQLSFLHIPLHLLLLILCAAIFLFLLLSSHYHAHNNIHMIQQITPLLCTYKYNTQYVYFPIESLLHPPNKSPIDGSTFSSKST